jgi:hypothetical protein
MHKLLAALAILLLSVTGAVALQTGTPAWTIRDVVLFEGPGVAYQTLGSISGEARVYVDRCHKRWCQVHAGGDRGWVGLDDLAFGHEPKGPFTGPRLEYKGGGPGTVCLYEGPNLSGAALCAGPGYVVHDLLLFGADNRYSSVSIEGNVSVILCSERDFHDYCERINYSRARLNGFLDNNVTSVRVY